jgi:hypothetical protein
MNEAPPIEVYADEYRTTESPTFITEYGQSLFPRSVGVKTLTNLEALYNNVRGGNLGVSFSVEPSKGSQNFTEIKPFNQNCSASIIRGVDSKPIFEPESDKIAMLTATHCTFDTIISDSSSTVTNISTAGFSDSIPLDGRRLIPITTNFDEKGESIQIKIEYGKPETEQQETVTDGVEEVETLPTVSSNDLMVLATPESLPDVIKWLENTNFPTYEDLERAFASKFSNGRTLSLTVNTSRDKSTEANWRLAQNYNGQLPIMLSRKHGIISIRFEDFAPQLTPGSSGSIGKSNTYSELGTQTISVVSGYWGETIGKSSTEIGINSLLKSSLSNERYDFVLRLSQLGKLGEELENNEQEAIEFAKKFKTDKIPQAEIDFIVRMLGPNVRLLIDKPLTKEVANNLLLSAREKFELIEALRLKSYDKLLQEQLEEINQAAHEFNHSIPSKK